MNKQIKRSLSTRAIRLLDFSKKKKIKVQDDFVRKQEKGYQIKSKGQLCLRIVIHIAKSFDEKQPIRKSIPQLTTHLINITS